VLPTSSGTPPTATPAGAGGQLALQAVAPLDVAPAAAAGEKGFGVEDWLDAYRSPATREAYERDARRWLAWCAGHGVDPRTARRPDADAWRIHLEQAGAAARSVARAIAAASSLYAYLLDAELVQRNPFARVRRPRPGDPGHAETPALDTREAAALLLAAARPRELPRTRAAVALLVVLGLRVSELVAADVTDLGHERGHRVLSITRKGGARQRLAVPPAVAELVDHALTLPDGTLRTTGPLIATATGARMDRRALHRTVVRLAAAAGIPAAHIGPHALRRTAATLLLDDGVPLRDVQQLLGHRDPRTTAGYDRGRRGLTRQAAALGHLAATLLPDPVDPAEHPDPDNRSSPAAAVHEDLTGPAVAVPAESTGTAQAADVLDQDQAVSGQGNERGAEPPFAVAVPAAPSAGGRVVDLSDQLGEPAGTWQVAETEPGSGSWAVLRDGVRVGVVRRESTSRGRRGWLARLDTGGPLPAHGDLATAGSTLWRARDLAAAAIARQVAARPARRWRRG
jgi:integrase/recombinase XerD